MNRYLRTVFILILLPTLSLFSQAKIQSVDITMAQKQISVIEKDNVTNQEHVGGFIQENKKLEITIKEKKPVLNNVKSLIAEVRTSRDEIYALINKVVDKGVKAKAQNSYDDMTKLLKSLVEKQNDIDGQLQVAVEKRDQNIHDIKAHQLLIQRNSERIKILKASIQFTKEQHAALDAAIQKTQTISQKASKFLPN